MTKTTIIRQIFSRLMTHQRFNEVMFSQIAYSSQETVRAV
jgi:hypothetical protein